MDTKTLSIKEARKLLDDKSISSVELTKEFLKNTESQNKNLNIYLEVFDDCLDQAKQADAAMAKGESDILTGIPLAIKDNILINGRVATSASKILAEGAKGGYRATYNATAIEKLLKQSPIFIGRTNMDEFACGGSTENSAFGVTKNPIDPERVSGGSSGGSAAAVAAHTALGSLGSDTGGSIREPASFCGIVGLKPTYGRVSRYGLMAMGSSLDCIGPMAKTVSDVETLFNVIKGKDNFDGTTVDENDIKPKKVKEKMSIGVPYHVLDQKGISTDVKENIKSSIEKFKNLGFEIKEIKLPNIDKALAVYYIVMPAELSSNMSRYDGMKYGLSVDASNLIDVYRKTRGQGFGPEVRRRIILGTYVLSAGYYDAYYGKAIATRKILRDEFSKVFEEVDAILTPTTPTPAFKIGEKSSPLEMYLADIFTVSANIVGCPAISIPSGFSDKLPLGVQLMAPNMSEDILFQMGKKFLGE